MFAPSGVESDRGWSEVLVMAGRQEEAAHLLGEAEQLHEHKGNIVSAQRARALIAELDL